MQDSALEPGRHGRDSRILAVEGLPEAAGPPAVVVDVGWVNGLAAIRSLGRAGATVYAVDHRPWALGLRSRYATRLVSPDPATEEEAFVACLTQLGERLDRPAPLFATHDAGLNAIARRQDELGTRFLFPFPDRATMERIQNKRTQLEAAQAAGVDIPGTAHPRTAAEALSAARDLGFPVLVKPADPVEFKRLHKRQAFRARPRPSWRTRTRAPSPTSP